MFSEEYKNLCIENAEKPGELWEPKFGDWIYTPDNGETGVLWGESGEFFVYMPQGEYPSASGLIMLVKEKCIPLPTQRQLWGMLEERVLCPLLMKVGEWMQSKGAGAYRVVWGDQYIEGPDPETALLKALIEVMKDE